ncbi:MAG: hypothetical protein R3185_06440, partial [Candidatus Thermoplasmatota archaeon]|nr:hypothetical protein [Candidatus Thermoplasmatota archaeon]
FNALLGLALLGGSLTGTLGTYAPGGLAPFFGPYPPAAFPAVSTTFTMAENGPTFERGFWQTSSSGTFTVLEGEHLYFELCNDSTQPATILTAGESWVETPSNQPAFPTPELGALLLTGLGILAIAGVARVRRN